ncbi:hypothetical protein Q8G31_30315 [Priestia megaterium]|uniref:hypothetical protein n=1 Tax=Priestia megaterium TaxID=1404 RepID=UPI002730E288|nr:hypothetical protein [Priestia megaterium]MDP1383942.1 hypothetical protein [Priestia megaterium]MDP1428094.1 hypothetical protein [Priestia megaterium]
MGNRKKQNRKRKELDINELFKRIAFETKQSKRTFKEVEDLLNRSQQLMRKLPMTRNNILANENAFFDVGGAPAAPVAPPIVPPAPSPEPAAPTLTPNQRRLVMEIFGISRRLRNLRFQYAFAVINLSDSLDRLANSEDDEDIDLIIAQVLVSSVLYETALRQIADEQGRLLATVLELEVSLGL